MYYIWYRLSDIHVWLRLGPAVYSQNSYPGGTLLANFLYYLFGTRGYTVGQLILLSIRHPGGTLLVTPQIWVTTFTSITRRLSEIEII